MKLYRILFIIFFTLTNSSVFAYGDGQLAVYPYSNTNQDDEKIVLKDYVTQYDDWVNIGTESELFAYEALYDNGNSKLLHQNELYKKGYLKTSGSSFLKLKAYLYKNSSKPVFPVQISMSSGQACNSNSSNCPTTTFTNGQQWCVSETDSFESGMDVNVYGITDSASFSYSTGWQICEDTSRTYSCAGEPGYTSYFTVELPTQYGEAKIYLEGGTRVTLTPNARATDRSKFMGQCHIAGGTLHGGGVLSCIGFGDQKWLMFRAQGRFPLSNNSPQNVCRYVEQ